jgi:hypothetical protein
MTTKNAVLLIIKQFPGIDYNTLVSKIASDYGSVNSARAALSRALKDMNALGLVGKRDNRWFVLEKGTLVLNSEMKNKLLFKLNTTVSASRAEHEIDSIVEQLSTLIERSKNDADLLRAAKTAVRFSLSDLSAIAVSATARQQQLAYLADVLDKQVKSLQELDFLDTRQIAPLERTIPLLQELLAKANPAEVFVTTSPETAQQLAAQFSEKSSHENLHLSPKSYPAFVAHLASQIQEGRVANLTVSFSPYALRFLAKARRFPRPTANCRKL